MWTNTLTFEGAVSSEVKEPPLFQPLSDLVLCFLSVVEPQPEQERGH